MIKSIMFALAIVGLAAGLHTAGKSHSASQNGLFASGGSNCPVYYGCPAPPPPAPKGGGGGGGGNGGGGADNPQPHA